MRVLSVAGFSRRRRRLCWCTKKSDKARTTLVLTLWEYFWHVRLLVERKACFWSLGYSSRIVVIPFAQSFVFSFFSGTLHLKSNILPFGRPIVYHRVHCHAAISLLFQAGAAAYASALRINFFTVPIFHTSLHLPIYIASTPPRNVDLQTNEQLEVFY